MTTEMPLAVTGRGHGRCAALAITGWLVALLVGVYALVVDHDGRGSIDLRGYVEHPSPYSPGARIATDELCDADFPCIQALDSDTLTMRRFETAPEAAAAGAALGGDVRVSGWIVIQFKPGRLTEEERAEFASAQYCDHVAADFC